jgi:hypothetical protein
MANAIRGEVAFNLGDNEYKMRLSASRIAEIEGALKRPFGAIVGEMANGSIECTAVVSAKAMGMPVNAVYALIDDHTLEPFAMAAVEAINLCGVFPKTGGEPVNPPKATAN